MVREKYWPILISHRHVELLNSQNVHIKSIIKVMRSCSTRPQFCKRDTVSF